MNLQQTDSEGYLIDPLLWDESVAEELAVRENIMLTPVHWEVIRFMRGYYEEHQVPPDTRHAIKHLAGQFGSQARNMLFELFPYGYVQQACMIAGMRKPRIWSTG